MKEEIEELTRLFEVGKNANDQFDQLFETLVPKRLPNFLKTPQVEIGKHGFSYTRHSDSEPEHKRLVEFLETIKKHTDNWVNDVNTVLTKTEKTRYRLQFNDPQGMGSIVYVGEITDNESRLIDVINDFSRHIDELRKIIIDYEATSEQTPQTTEQAVEPASYDPKTRTIFFADEAIRFNKNAEYQSAICSLIFKKPEATWGLKDFLSVWDTQYDYLPDLQKPSDWNKVYEIIKKMNMRVASATGIKDLFKLSTKSVRLNPKYITQSKKRP